MDKNDVRATLRIHVERLLLGPMEEIECLESNPSDTYLTGILWPRGSTIPPDEDDAGTSELATGDTEAMEVAVPGYRAVRPCSIGLTCTIDAGIPIEIDLEGSAKYIPVSCGLGEGTTSGSASDDAGNTKFPVDIEVASTGSGTGPEEHDWHRCPIRYRLLIAADEKRTSWRVHDFLLPDGSGKGDPDIEVDIRRREIGGRIVLTATLINAAAEPEGGLRDRANIFQARLRISAAGANGEPAIRPRESHPLVDDEDALTNLLLYRDVCEFATGHGISAEWPSSETLSVPWVATSWMPKAIVEGTSPEGHESLSKLRSRDPNPFVGEWLADESRQKDVCTALEEFCSLYGNWISTSLKGRTSEFKGNPHLEKAAGENLKRCEMTLSRLRRGVATLNTSATAWSAFALANRAMDLQSRFPSKKDKARPLVWRPFQLAFLLLVIPSIVDGRDPDRETMDLLWFPTGGGKTEAYLGLTAFEIFFRRLELKQRREEGGVDVLMRYTLRLLTVQQFQRAAALILACEQIRVQDSARLGQARITLGLYVGDDSTPNRLADADTRLLEERQGQQPKSTPRQLLKCPVCGGDLPVSAYRPVLNEVRLDIRCPSSCCPTNGEPLPVMTVDEVIYATPPSLLIGTIDKFAQLPRRTNIRHLFGLDGNVRPGLIIQDELHLISGPLGSMTGLYEAAIDFICTVDGVRPKIVGSTATIGRAGRQVRALFDRDVLQFPPPGFDSADSFFAVRDSCGPDRTYVGVATAGRSPKFALQAVVAALLQSIATSREKGEAADADIDPYWTCVAYFNSLRELGGAHVLMLDDVPRQMQFLSRRLQSIQRLIEEPPTELSSRVSSRQIPEVLLRLEQALNSGDPFSPVPVHAVLASNMISVGVDISRLGLMVVNGQPKSTAEYIQATSRVGRGLPGLVVTLYNFGRPRDVSHFEHFQNYHGALYRGVEATSVTPWAPRARDKALHAVFISLVRQLIGGLLEDEDAIRFDPGNPEVRVILDYMVARAEKASDGLEDVETRGDLEEIVKTWARRSADSNAAGKKLRYWEKRAPFGRTAPHLMRAAEEMKGQESTAWPTPNSMREVEPSTAFVLKRIARRVEEDHGNTTQ